MHHVPKTGPIWQRGRTSIFHLQNSTQASLNRVMGDVGFGEIRIEVRNELTWPVSRCVRIYLVELRGLPSNVAPVVSALLYPLSTTETFNAHKAIQRARRPAAMAGCRTRLLFGRYEHPVDPPKRLDAPQPCRVARIERCGIAAEARRHPDRRINAFRAICSRAKGAQAARRSAPTARRITEAGYPGFTAIT